MTNNDKIEDHIIIENNIKVAYLDLRFYNLNNNIFENSGWIKEEIYKPICYYFNTNNNKNLIRNINKINGKYYRIYDCGHVKYVENK